MFELSLRPFERSSLFFAVECNGSEPLRPRAERFFVGLHEARRALRTSTARAAAVETSNEIFNEVLCRSIADLHMLVTDTAHGPYPYAGIPWFCTAFGRDGIITAMQLLWIDPAIAKGVLKFLAATQAGEQRPEADAEPGKILHETRQGEMAQLGEVPFGMYYGSVDATPLFVMLAGMYYERTGDLDTIRTIWPNVQAALGWIDEWGDRDGDGFVEYAALGERGLRNQGWKDFQDCGVPRRWPARRRRDRAVRGPGLRVRGQAPCRPASRPRSASAGWRPRCGARPRTLRERFETAFWCPDIATYALALDGAKQPCRVRTSNAGQVLLSGIASPRRAARTADLLMDRALFSGWGIRTVAESEARYNPMSYHNGSVWPHDNALIALGFGRYGLSDRVARLFHAHVRGGKLHGSASPAGAVLRIPARGRQGADVLSGGLLASSLGERRSLRLPAGLPWPELRSARRAGAFPTAAPARFPRSGGDPAAPGRRQPVRRHAAPLRRRRLGQRARSPRRRPGRDHAVGQEPATPVFSRASVWTRLGPAAFQESPA